MTRPNALLIVESPSKARTIRKYLGPDYAVLASFGHVRDLPVKKGSVEPEKDFLMHWEIGQDSKKHLDSILEAARDAKTLILATDPDREGEAIAWHILEILKQKKALKGKEIARVVFNSVTKKAVLEALEHPRAIESALVEAYLARRALDYLVGFTLSPVLWRKLPGARSAGRVQSVALRLTCAREHAIEIFETQEYWSLTAHLLTPSQEEIQARLVQVGEEKIGRLDISSATRAGELKEDLEKARFHVLEIEAKPQNRSPQPPFTTSTLQQEAARQFGFSATQTMQIAQRLYEGVTLKKGESEGLITYMRTDAVQMIPEAVEAARETILTQFSKAYLPEKPRLYVTKAKNAQEAHEAIRPTEFKRTPEEAAAFLDSDQAKLYGLIWRRAVASQMENARFERTRVEIEARCPETERVTQRRMLLRATGSVLLFDGYLALYQEKTDDAKEEALQKLPQLSLGLHLQLQEIIKKQHFTEPPPRYTEASLVKKMEELGIGRPSTYASTLRTLQNRDYVHLSGKRMIPEEKGRLVTAFLEAFFEKYVGYDFTASLEENLDKIAAGARPWREVLEEFWEDFSKAISKASALRLTEVIDTLNATLRSYLFPGSDTSPDLKHQPCPTCGKGYLSLKMSRFGAFVGCSNYPECSYTRKISSPSGEVSGAESPIEWPLNLGKDPQTGKMVTLRSGRFGPYVQLGEGEKPPRAKLPEEWPFPEVTLEKALLLLSLPRAIAPHPETGEMITAGLNRFGPFLRHGSQYIRLPTIEDSLNLTFEEALKILANPPRKLARSTTASLIRTLGTHPSQGGEINLLKGRYGPYVKHGKLNASLPKDADPESVTLEEALALLKKRESVKSTKASSPKKEKKKASKISSKKATKTPPKRAKTEGGQKKKAGASP